MNADKPQFCEKLVQLDLSFDPPQKPQLMSPNMLFEAADEALLRRAREDRYFEAKPNSYSLKSLGEYICMWSNTQPHGGLIAIGIRNNNSFEGCRRMSQQDLNMLEKFPDHHCSGAIWNSKRVSIRRDGDGEEDFIILFRVEYHPTRLIKTSVGRIFIRKGDSKYQVKATEEILALQNDKGERSFEAGPAGLAYPDDFDKPAITAFADGVRETKQWDPEHSAEDVLELMKLGKNERGDFIPNMACALLFAKDPRSVVPGCRIRLLRFEGEKEGSGDRWNAIKDEFIDGTVSQQIQSAATMIKSQLRTFSRLDKNNKFYTSPEYPDPAWYEAIVNACVHRSYGNGLGNRPIFVRMFDDRLVIESPGPFPPFVTVENIYESHHPRNPYLMDAMFYMEYVRCAHEGTRRIRDTMLKLELPEPEFKQQEIGESQVRVTLRNNVKHRKAWVDSDVAQFLGARIAQQLNTDERRCLNHVAEHGKISVSDAQRLTGKTWPASRKMLIRLTEIGILDHNRRQGMERDVTARFVLRKKWASRGLIQILLGHYPPRRMLDKTLRLKESQWHCQRKQR